MGYVVACGDGSDEDRDVLREIQCGKYHGQVVLIKGWKPKDDDLFDNCCIIEGV
jgi:hypothetical protein